MNGIHINKYIRKWLTENSEVTSLVPAKNIVPLVVSPTAQPFITFQHGSIEPDYTNDGCVVDHVQVLIVVVATDYEESIDIAAAVRKAVEYNKYEDENIYIPVITISQIDEAVENDNYLQEILVEFEIQSKN